MRTLTLTPAEAGRALVAHHQLAAPWTAGAAALLEALGAVQLDPIDRIGTNADLVLHARIDDMQRGDWRRLLGSGGAFEHYAKERCVLPAHRFPWFREHAVAFPEWRLTQRLKRVEDALLDAVLAEVAQRGPCSAADLSDHGAVRPLDWSGWVGTSKAGTMALEVLALRCQLVVVGRTRAGQRVLDLPERALPAWHDAPDSLGDAGAVLHRVAMCGLLREADGPQWRGLGHVRRSPLVDGLVEQGALVRVQVAGSRRRYLAAPSTLEATARVDDRMRILAPLDPVIWDRELVAAAFGFSYVWEVYKPAAKRQYGYYVCPLLHRGRLVGRIEARRTPDHDVMVLGCWGDPDPDALASALDRLRSFQPQYSGATTSAVP